VLWFLALFTKELCLVRQCDRYFPASRLQHALAAKPRVDAWIHRPVYKILFFIAQFFQVAHAVVNIQVAGAAGAYGSAVMMQINIVIKTNLQQTLVG
jgi:hypothetical protein